MVVLLLGAFACAPLNGYPPEEADFDRGLALFNHGNFSRAIPYFLRATEENPNSAEAYLYLGRSYLSLRRWRAALQPLRTAYRLAPDETKDQVFEIMMDAFLGAALATGSSPFGPEPQSSTNP